MVLKKIKKTLSFLMLTSFSCSLPLYAGPAKDNLLEDGFEEEVLQMLLGSGDVPKAKIRELVKLLERMCTFNGARYTFLDPWFG